MEISNDYFIVNMAERVMKGQPTLFLNQAELKKVINCLNKTKIEYKIFFPYDGAEKVIVYKDVKPGVTLLEIKSKNVLKHSDILGSLFGNNISSNNYGDIIIKDNKYYIVVINQLLRFFLTQFTQIGKFNIEVKEIQFDIIKDYQIKYDELRILCSSLRIDNIVSSLINLSRRLVDELFSKEDVLLNYESTKKFKNLEEGDILSIRKYGKYKIKQILEKNKKGKIVIEVLKYK